MVERAAKDIHLVDPRHTVEVHLPDARVLSGPRNAQVGDFLYSLPESHEPPIVGAIVNGELRELTYEIRMDSQVTPITMGDVDGMRIYRRSLIFLLESAFRELYPDGFLTVDHSVASGGYYCQVRRSEQFSSDELKDLEARMRQLVQEDLPFIRKEVPLNESVEYFKQHGEEDKVHLLSHRKKNYVTMYQLGEYCDYHHGYMVPSTGFMRWFELSPIEGGFTLRFPRRHSPTKLSPAPQYPKLLKTFRQYGNWLEKLGISSVGALNDAICEHRADEIVLVSEAFHEQRMSEIASQIASQIEQIRVILVAGPSSSGKTTFSKRITIQLLANGISPFPLGMDNYFVDRDKTPLDEEGKPDFESVQALNLERLTEDLQRLISSEKVQIPRFNFISGKSEVGNTIQLHPGQIIIMEGIHGLNPELLSDFSPAQTFRIYVSALTQLNLDRHNRISTTDTRLIRRVVRDARERGYPAQETIQRWESVRRGEKRYIYPYQENADIMFNSALAYELSALKSLAEPLLRQVPFSKPEYIEAKRLLAFLEWFLPLDNSLIPDNSILREFIGESSLSDFALWHNHHNGDF